MPNLIELSIDEIFKITKSIKSSDKNSNGFCPTLDPINHEAKLWFIKYQGAIELHNGSQLAKECLLEFLDEVGLDFYYKITR
jgi:hypothetical protein